MDRNLFQEKLNSLPLKQARIRDGFWSGYQTLVTLTARGWRSDREEFGPSLYRTGPPGLKPARLVFLPYCPWGSRGTGETAVWVRYAPNIPAGGAHVHS